MVCLQVRGTRGRHSYKGSSAHVMGTKWRSKSAPYFNCRRHASKRRDKDDLLCCTSRCASEAHGEHERDFSNRSFLSSSKVRSFLPSTRWEHEPSDVQRDAKRYSDIDSTEEEERARRRDEPIRTVGMNQCTFGWFPPSTSSYRLPSHDNEAHIRAPSRWLIRRGLLLKFQDQTTARNDVADNQQYRR